MQSIAERYRTFAWVEAHGVSARYEALADLVADTPEALAFLSELPVEKQQPNLFFAALRQTTGLPRTGRQLRDQLALRGNAVRQVMLTRTTQTNEPGRCAVLVPVMARLGGPLALLEVGASAGLCLLPDRYGYAYGSHRIAPGEAGSPRAPEFPCETRGGIPLPAAVPEIVWRAGIDLNPLDVRLPEDRAWLRALVWPDQPDRAERLDDALLVAARNPPRVLKGDLLTDLSPVVASAPSAARLVIFHTAVLAYISDVALRRDYAERMADLDAVWICNESPNVFPEWAERAPPSPGPDWFLLAVDGEPVAWTKPHGQAIYWFGR